MNIPTEILLISSSVGAVQGGFFGLYLLSATDKNRPSSRLLGFLMLALAVRMAKSVGYYFSSDNLPTFIENIGYAAHLAIGPLLFLYVKSFVDDRFVVKKRRLLHLFPSLIAVALSLVLDDWFWLAKNGGYFFSLFYFGAYFPFIYYSLFKNRVSKEETNWLLFLSIGINLVWAAYAANFLLGLVTYITAPLVFSMVIYGISFFAFSRKELFVRATKYQHSILTTDQIQAYAKRLENLMTIDKLYRDPHLTLPKLAKRISASTQTTSEIINRHFQMSFAVFLNSYRLKDAEQMLLDPQNSDRKIAAIAFECGFGALSSFNTAFKKHTGVTPSEYKRNTETQLHTDLLIPSV
jgi:AraC-like DNA-binding protein